MENPKSNARTKHMIMDNVIRNCGMHDNQSTIQGQINANNHSMLYDNEICDFTFFPPVLKLNSNTAEQSNTNDQKIFFPTVENVSDNFLQNTRPKMDLHNPSPKK